MPSTTQGLTQPIGEADQTLEKNIPLDKTCYDGSHPLIGAQMEENKEEERKVKEPKDVTNKWVTVCLQSFPSKLSGTAPYFYLIFN